VFTASHRARIPRSPFRSWCPSMSLHAGALKKPATGGAGLGASNRGSIQGTSLSLGSRWLRPVGAGGSTSPLHINPWPNWQLTKNYCSRTLVTLFCRERWGL
jgi:hypothetical protein